MTLSRPIPVIVLELIQDLLVWMRTQPSPSLAALLEEVGSLLAEEPSPRLLKPKVVRAIDRHLSKTQPGERQTRLRERALGPSDEVEVAEKDMDLLILGCRGFAQDRGGEFSNWAPHMADAFHALPEILAAGNINRYSFYRGFLEPNRIRMSCRLTEVELSTIQNWISDVSFEDKLSVWFPRIHRLLWKTQADILVKHSDDDQWTL